MGVRINKISILGLTGRYVFKKKLSGMVLYVEENIAAGCNSPQDVLYSHKVIWRKAKEEDIIELKLNN